MAKDNRGRRSWRQAFLPSRPVIFVAAVYLLGMVFFTLLRLLFYINFAEFASDEGAMTIVTAFLIGLRFDQIVVLAALLPVILAASFIKLDYAAFRRAVTVFLTVVFGASFLLLLADIRFYSYFDSRLNFLAVEYLGDGSTMGNLIVTDPEFFPTLFTWLLIVTLFSVFLVLAMKRTAKMPHMRSLPNHIVYTLLLIALAILGIRGRVSLAPMDWGVAYYSQNRFLNQLALNGVYTLGRNLGESNRDPRLVYLSDNERFPLVPFSEALGTTREMLASDNQEWLEPDSSLLRIARQPAARYGYQPNVIIIMAESWPAQLTGALGDHRNLTPNFDRLASRGLLFENFYATGNRTNYGIGAIFCSFPALPGRAIMKRYNAEHPFVSLSELLDARGYTNTFAYGGDLAFDNMEGFLREKKFHRFYGEDELGRDLYFSKWGIPDHVLFEKSASIVDSLPRPFHLTVLTLSNHEPWDLPDSTVRRYLDDEDSSKIFNSQIYADHSLGVFFKLMENKPVFDSTIFLFVSDHARYGPSRFILDTKYFRVPFLVYAPGPRPDLIGRSSAFGSQTDILPTLMGLLGGDYTHASWGRDLMNLPDGDNGFAVMNVSTRIGYIDSAYLYVEDLNGLTGFGTSTLAGGETSWFGYATLRGLDVLNRDFTHQNWERVYLASLEPAARFAATYALNRTGTIGRGHLIIQTLQTPTDTGNDSEPRGLKWTRERLRRFMQAADQLSTPEARQTE